MRTGPWKAARLLTGIPPDESHLFYLPASKFLYPRPRRWSRGLFRKKAARYRRGGESFIIWTGGIMKKEIRYKPIETRTYKLRNPAMTFFCPLCRMERAVTVRPGLKPIHFLQITLVTLFLVWLSWSLMGLGAFVWFFVVWGIFEAVLRVTFRKEVPCPHCGFDASWYKRDVKMARKLVSEFWAGKKPVELPETHQKS